MVLVLINSQLILILHLYFVQKYRTLLKRNSTIQKRPTAIYGKIEQPTDN